MPMVISIRDPISQPALPSNDPESVESDALKPENPKAANPPPTTIMGMQNFLIDTLTPLCTKKALAITRRYALIMRQL